MIGYSLHADQKEDLKNTILCPDMPCKHFFLKFTGLQLNSRTLQIVLKKKN